MVIRNEDCYVLDPIGWIRFRNEVNRKKYDTYVLVATGLQSRLIVCKTQLEMRDEIVMFHPVDWMHLRNWPNIKMSITSCYDQFAKRPNCVKN